jgi:hypothetical protein
MAAMRRFGSRGRRAAAALAACGAALLLATATAQSGSSSVAGRLTSEAVTGPACTSPVGVCTRGALKGGLKGTFTFTASSVTATADTPTTSVVAYTGDMVVTTSDGTLTCRDAGAFATTGERSFAGVCTVVGGTGEFAGASGRLRLTGVTPDFGGAPDAGGEADYEGTLAR